MNHIAINSSIWTTNSQCLTDFEICRSIFDFCGHALLISKLKTGFCMMWNIQSEVPEKVRVISILVVYYKTVWPQQFCTFLVGLKSISRKNPATVLG